MTDLFQGPQEQSPAPSPNGSRLDKSGWRPGEQDRSFATMCGLDPDFIWAEFKDYWTAKSGANATKRDWPATWRNWCRKAEGDKRNRTRFSNTPSSDNLLPDKDLTRRWVGGIAYNYVDALAIRQKKRAGIYVSPEEAEAMRLWNL